MSEKKLVKAAKPKKLADPIKHARLMIAHIDKKRKALGIDKARERVLMDMADRREMEAAYQEA